MRWQVVLGIYDARRKLGESVRPLTQKTTGTPLIRAIAPRKSEVKQTDKVLQALRMSGPIDLDGKVEESFWRTNRNSTNSLWWTGEVENAMRAKAGGLDEFQKLPSPSSSQAQFAYDDQGLYMLVQCNHSTLENALSKFGDDDMNLWQDDCMEFFFDIGKAAVPYYHLIVSVKGKRVLVEGETKVVRDTGIRTASVSVSNGYCQEIFVPWKALGFSDAPQAGTIWRMNVAREFHSWRQMMTWGSVDSRFNDKSRWGVMVFGGTDGLVMVEQFDPGSRFPGRNQMKGLLVVDPSVQDHALQAVLVNEENKPVTRQTIMINKAKGPVQFEMKYTVPAMELTVSWQLQFADSKGKKLGETVIPILAAPTLVSLERCPSKVISGWALEMEITLRLGELSLANRRLEGMLVSSEGKKCPACCFAAVIRFSTYLDRHCRCDTGEMVDLSVGFAGRGFQQGTVGRGGGSSSIHFD